MGSPSWKDDTGVMGIPCKLCEVQVAFQQKLGGVGGFLEGPNLNPKPLSYMTLSPEP